jgi:cytochrome c556
MNRLLKNLSVASMMAGAIFTAVPSAFAAKDDAIAKGIKSRRASMQLYNFFAGHLFAMAKGEMEYDADLAELMAKNLDAINKLRNGRAWLPGSDNKKRKGKTRALPEIWKEGSSIGEKAEAMEYAVDSMVMVAGDGLDALRGEIGTLGDACKGCHDDFRAKDF